MKKNQINIRDPFIVYENEKYYLEENYTVAKAYKTIEKRVENSK